MNTYQHYFKDKKVTVVRIGLLGRGVGDTAFMAELGAEVLVVDDASQEDMQPSVDALKEYDNVRFKFGPYDLNDFVDADMVLVGAGMPYEHAVLVAAKEAGVPLKQSAALFAELSGIPIIGVTGTRGKSTTTSMIHHVLSQATGEEVLLGGNIRGVSNLQLLKDVHEDSIAVMELDSWQLQGWGWADMSPQIAVFTNFMEDHLNYYQKDGESKEQGMERYFTDKAQIFLHQEESGVLITTPEVFERARTVAGSLGQEVVLADSSVLPEDCLLAMPGEHNRLNAALAYEALKATSLPDDIIFEGLASFPGVEGRLQYLREVDFVRYYNDNNATTPQATIAALTALDVGNKNIVLIAGGAYKAVNPAPLVEAIKKHCKQTILIPGTGTDRLLSELEKIRDTIPNLVVENLAQAFEEARLVAENGDIVLFSPGFASFGQYKNEYERNDEFVQLVSDI
ncbi:MAG: UDP-N-acetylmuramoyl-L-alanine--D-glutamate ligase [Candidatus Pacebacteria bacterium]|nr:UDP-N-acetylmuramoyl-L-alanine--D-glutamate ligase [Candidatus Paceibacterota bacterium]